jgi:hypothetical protein
MTKKITPQIKAIADAHINANFTSKWDDPSVTTREEVLSQLRDGKTFSGVLRQIEIRFVSTTSLIMHSQLGYVSDAYKKAVYKGFKLLLG